MESDCSEDQVSQNDVKHGLVPTSNDLQEYNYYKITVNKPVSPLVLTLPPFLRS